MAREGGVCDDKIRLMELQTPALQWLVGKQRHRYISVVFVGEQRLIV